MTTGRLSQVALMQELEVTEFCAMATINTYRYLKMGRFVREGTGGEEAPSSAGHLRRMTHCGFARPFAHVSARSGDRDVRPCATATISTDDEMMMMMNDKFSSY